MRLAEDDPEIRNERMWTKEMQNKVDETSGTKHDDGEHSYWLCCSRSGLVSTSGCGDKSCESGDVEDESSDKRFSIKS